MAARIWRHSALSAARRGLTRLAVSIPAAAVLAGGLVAPAGTAAAAQSWISPDELTLSGRWELPRGAGTPLGRRLNIVYVVVDPSIAAAMDVKPEALKTALTEAVNKSFFNFGYLAAPANPASAPTAQATAADLHPIDITVEVLPMTQVRDDKGLMVTSAIKMTAAADAGQCFPYVANGHFHALTRLKSGGDQRAVGVLAIVAFAAVGMNAGQFAADQFREAAANNEALNSRRVVGDGEGVAPPGGASAEARYGAISALQLAVANLIQHLGQAGGCNAPPAAAPASLQPVSTAPTPVGSATAPAAGGAISATTPPAPAPAGPVSPAPAPAAPAAPAETPPKTAAVKGSPTP